VHIFLARYITPFYFITIESEIKSYPRVLGSAFQNPYFQEPLMGIKRAKRNIFTHILPSTLYLLLLLFNMDLRLEEGQQEMYSSVGCVKRVRSTSTSRSATATMLPNAIFLILVPQIHVSPLSPLLPSSVGVLRIPLALTTENAFQDWITTRATVGHAWHCEVCPLPAGTLFYCCNSLLL
jgi:hypothetical protein